MKALRSCYSRIWPVSSQEHELVEELRPTLDYNLPRTGELMSCRDNLNNLYEILGDLRERVGGCRRLGECTVKIGWPERGMYFFFEDGEFREDQKTLRVVRIGTHAITASSRTTLWNVSTRTGGIPILVAIIAVRFFGGASENHS